MVNSAVPFSLSARRLAVVAAVSVGVWYVPLNMTPVAGAQQSFSVYPVYDGYLTNADGSLTLSFAYFSHNRQPVTIPIGPDNAFSPGPPDRGQPETFLPGHHRWQCIVVVDEGFDGNLLWTLTHRGETTSTSELMLQYSWEFDASGVAAVGRGFDAAKAPRNVCVNRPPIVRVLGYGGRRGPHELRVAVGAELKLFGSVRDEGLPKGGAVTASWRTVSGPGTVSFEDIASARTRATFDAAGTYELELFGSDSLLDATTRVTVVVE